MGLVKNNKVWAKALIQSNMAFTKFNFPRQANHPKVPGCWNLYYTYDA